MDWWVESIGQLQKQYSWNNDIQKTQQNNKIIINLGHSLCTQCTRMVSMPHVIACLLCAYRLKPQNSLSPLFIVFVCQTNVWSGKTIVRLNETRAQKYKKKKNENGNKTQIEEPERYFRRTNFKRKMVAHAQTNETHSIHLAKQSTAAASAAAPVSLVQCKHFCFRLIYFSFTLISYVCFSVDSHLLHTYGDVSNTTIVRALDSAHIHA